MEVLPAYLPRTQMQQACLRHHLIRMRMHFIIKQVRYGTSPHLHTCTSSSWSLGD